MSSPQQFARVYRSESALSPQRSSSDVSGGRPSSETQRQLLERLAEREAELRRLTQQISVLRAGAGVQGSPPVGLPPGISSLVNGPTPRAGGSEARVDVTSPPPLSVPRASNPRLSPTRAPRQSPAPIQHSLRGTAEIGGDGRGVDPLRGVNNGSERRSPHRMHYDPQGRAGTGSGGSGSERRVYETNARAGGGSGSERRSYEDAQVMGRTVPAFRGTGGTPSYSYGELARNAQKYSPPRLSPRPTHAFSPRSLGLSMFGLPNLTDGPELLCGPVVGKLTSTSATVLLEVSQAGCVALTLRAVGKGSEGVQPVRITRMLPAGEAYAFEIGGLRSNTLYNLEFEGLSSIAKGAVCVVRTPAPAPRARLCESDSLRVILIGGDAPGTKRGDEAWEEVARLTGSLGGPEQPRCVVVHMGGQAPVPDMLLRRAEGILAPLEEQEDDVNVETEKRVRQSARAVLREGHRVAWQREFLKAVFCSAQNLMLPGERDFAPEGTSPDVMRSVREVTDDYQVRLSWPQAPSASRSSSDFAAVPPPLFTRDGPFCVFCLQMRGTDEIMTRAERKALEEQLNSQTLQVLIICSPDVLVCGEHSEGLVVDLLDTLFSWLGGGEGREALIACGGSDSASLTTVTDVISGASLRQLVPCPFANDPADAPDECEGSVADGRYDFSVTPGSWAGRHVFAAVDLSLSRGEGQVSVKVHYGEQADPEREPDASPSQVPLPDSPIYSQRSHDRSSRHAR
eukprot:Hpha_TRINITY_DN15231_c1_g20::TRINITY_DN15231_c1_g20_i2::g.67703::m.67703